MIKVTIKNLSRDQADCFLLVFENEHNTITMLVDGNREGNASVKEIQKELENYDQLDYVVVTHIDTDHLGGVLRLLESNVESEKLEHTRIIYNYVTQVNVSFDQARRFEKIIKGREVIKSYNGGIASDDFIYFLSREERAICQDIGSNKKVFITFLSPDMEDANKVWYDYERGADEDSELINQQSIAFMIELGEYRLLFAGDTYWKEIGPRVDSLLEADSIVHMIKIPHHGAHNNNEGIAAYILRRGCEKIMVTGNRTWNQVRPEEELIQDLQEAREQNGLVVYSKVDLTPYFETSTEDIIYEAGDEDHEK